MDGGLPRPRARPEGQWKCRSIIPYDEGFHPGSRDVCYLDQLDLVNLDLKSTLRVLYNLFSKYKSQSST